MMDTVGKIVVGALTSVLTLAIAGLVNLYAQVSVHTSDIEQLRETERQTRLNSTRLERIETMLDSMDRTLQRVERKIERKQ